MATRPPRNTPAAKPATAKNQPAPPPADPSAEYETRLASLEHRVATLEASARTTEGTGTQPQPSPGPGPAVPRYRFVNGMTEPDEHGRVRLEAVERERAQHGDWYRKNNAEPAQFYFVRAALTTFPLNDQQRHNIITNTKENAIMRQGRAAVVTRDQAGRGHEEPWPTNDTVATFAESAEGAAQEVIAKYREAASGSPGQIPFGPRAPGG